MSVWVVPPRRPSTPHPIPHFISHSYIPLHPSVPPHHHHHHQLGACRPSAGLAGVWGATIGTSAPAEFVAWHSLTLWLRANRGQPSSAPAAAFRLILLLLGPAARHRLSFKHLQASYLVRSSTATSLELFAAQHCDKQDKTDFGCRQHRVWVEWVLHRARVPPWRVLLILETLCR